MYNMSFCICMHGLHMHGWIIVVVVVVGILVRACLFAVAAAVVEG